MCRFIDENIRVENYLKIFKLEVKVTLSLFKLGIMSGRKKKKKGKDDKKKDRKERNSR